ncbi:MAG TPA: hypothetical protein VLE21_00090 [Candidatus Nitrosocosmicus sp.]|nr:hypothetical protein [Candidatus Nitrosocosmicus sp.]
MSLSSKFSTPLFIYDDNCSSCTTFARSIKKLSRGWIRIAGHYYSQEAIDVKKIVFPPDYDSTRMSWLINKDGAFGARCGIVKAIKEIIIGNLKYRKNRPTYNEDDNNKVPIVCNYNKQMSCMSKKNTLMRTINMLKNCDTFRFSHNNR